MNRVSEEDLFNVFRLAYYGSNKSLAPELESFRRAYSALSYITVQAIVPDGYVLVPKNIFVEAESWEAAQFSFGGPGTGEGEEFMSCTLWFGDIDNDDGSKTHGLHVSCDECPEEGSITLSEFAVAPQHEVTK